MLGIALGHSVTLFVLIITLNINQLKHKMRKIFKRIVLATMMAAVVIATMVSDAWAQNVLTLNSGQDNSQAISDADGQQFNVVLDDYTLYRDGEWNTICLPFGLDNFAGTVFENATVKAFKSSTLNNNKLTIFFEEVTSIEAGKPYIVKWTKNLYDKDGRFVIRNLDDWNTFVDKFNNGNETSLNAVLDNDIEGVTQMVGTSQKSYSGTFDGNGHTITVNFTATGNYTAPFRYIKYATIKNLKVNGTINTRYKYAAGFVGQSVGKGTH